MTPKEKHVIEELLTGCSPTVQSIVNTHNKFDIPPPSKEGQNDDEHDASMTMVSQLCWPNDTINVSNLSSVAIS